MTGLTRRRALARAVAGVGASLAGCVAGSDDGTQPGDGNGNGDPEASIVDVRTVRYRSTTSPPRWYREDDGAAGHVVVIDDEERLRAAVDDAAFADRRDEFESFAEALDFERSVLLLVETVAPNLCFDEVQVADLRVADGRLRGEASALDTSEEDVGCAQAVAFPAALVRVDFESDPVREVELEVTDGRETTRTVVAGPDDRLGPDPADLPGVVRPDESPDPIPPLACDAESFERVPPGYEDEDAVSYGEVAEDGEPVLALRVDETSYGRGDAVGIRLYNVSDRVLSTGNAAKYNLEVHTEAGWTELRGSHEGPLAYTDEAVLHRPGEGFEWRVELTEAGLVADDARDLEVCPDLPGGRYRFVYWGVIGSESVAVEFDYEG